MKKLLLKYLPIPLAMIVAFACFLTVSYYGKNMTEYATLSYTSNYIAVDMTISQTGKITKVMPVDTESREKLSAFDCNGKNSYDIIYEFSKYAEEGETVFVGAYVLYDESTEPDFESLKILLDSACSRLEISCLASYGTYDNHDVLRSLSYKKSLGKIGFCSDYSNIFSEDFREYVDAYLMYDADPYELAFYLEYTCDKLEIENYDELFKLNLSYFKKENKHIGKENAEKIATEYLKTTFSDGWENFSFSGYKFDYGNLGYSFDFRCDGENRILFIDVNDGSVQEYFLDDY